MRVLLLSSLILVVAACDSPTQPAGDAGAPSLSVSAGVEASATGAGHFTNAAGHYRRFTFSALRQSDGSVHGVFQLKGSTGNNMHGTVTCITVVGNTARVGAIVDQAVGTVAQWTGHNVYFTVVDHGEGRGAQDLFSLVATRLSPNFREDLHHCAQGFNLALVPFENGNIQVH